MNCPLRIRASISACSSTDAACSARSISVSTSPMPRIRDAIRSGMEHLECVELLPGRAEQDRLAGHRLDRERCTAARVAVELRQQHAVEVEPLLERGRDVHRLLPGHRVEHEDRRRRLGRVADAHELVHQLFVDLEPAGGVDDHAVETVGAGALEPLASPPRPGRSSRCDRPGTPICAPSCSSWSIAAGRWRSAATSPGLRPCAFR